MNRNNEAKQQQLLLADFIPVVDLICRILNAHIPYSNVNSLPAVDSLVNRNILHYDKDLISLTKGYDSYVYFCSTLAAPLIDSIWVLTEVIQNLLPSCKQQEVDMNVLILKAMEVTRVKQEEGKIHYAYVANNQMIRNTIEGLVLAGILSKRKEGSIYYISLSSTYCEGERLISLYKSVNDLRTTSVAYKSTVIPKSVKSVCPKGKLKTQLKSVNDLRTTSVACYSES